MDFVELEYVDDPAHLFAGLAHLPYAIFFDSGRPYDQRERYSIIAASPRTLISIDQEDFSDPFALVKKYLQPYQSLSCPDEIKSLPFKCGAMGYFGYDLAHRYHGVSRKTRADIHLPIAVIGIYEWSVIIDHQGKKTWLVMIKKDRTLIDLIQKILLKNLSADETFKITAEFSANFSFDHYAQAFEKIQWHIRQGDCYQVNLCQRFSANYTGSLWQAYRQLRRINPAPFAIYMKLAHSQQAILSLSPERFLQVKQRQVETKPIKGTIARHSVAAEDQKNIQQLKSSEKDLAENLMIVDLLRNDLGKCCQPGSIRVPALAQIETFPQVHHLVSTITGKLKPSMHAIDLLRACFPGGSITGAPKKRAMEIIESLEPHQRSIYCGSMGYISYDGDMDCNIAIRTLIADNHRLHCYAGGGIVADSQLMAEYQESITKISNLITTLTR